MDKNNKIEALIQRYQEGTCSARERELVEEVLFLHPAKESGTAGEDTYKNALWDKLYPMLQQRRRQHRWYYAAAAIFIGVMCTALYFYVIVGNQKPEAVLIAATEILPGYNQATLTLADGTKVALDSAQSGIIVKDEDIKYNNGKKLEGIRHTAEGPSPVPGAIVNRKSELVNVLTTPKGGQYQIILSDGTKVWLNAASTLKYPSQFSGDKREVFLEGEAYFEVAKSGKTPKAEESQEVTAPFMVKTRNQQTLVLGTEFNISAYASDNRIKTTLVNGAVRVEAAAGANMTLAPREQAVWENDRLTKHKAHVENEIAWKNGLFSFDDKPFGEVMTELARWYNLQVKYEGPVPPDRFFGIAFRKEKLSLVLSLLESAGVSYRLEKGADGASNKLIISNQRKEAERH